MKRATLFFVGAAVAALFATSTLAQQPPGGRIVSQHGAAGDLEVRDVQTSPDGSAKGVVFNNSGKQMRSIKLLVKHTWYWKDERHPGEDSPGRSGFVALPGEIAPGGSTPFSYTPDPPLPERSDGSFKTTVSVQEFEQVGE